MNELPEWLTVAETAQFLRLSRATIDRLVREGTFPAPAKFGGATQRFSRSELLKFLDASRSREPMPSRQRKDARPQGNKKRLAPRVVRG